jgi:O-antigen/teichoic acid export membrane protein
MTPALGGAERIARSAALKVLVQATRFGSLVLVVVTARVIGPAEFGKFTFAYALATVLGVALDFGVSPVLTRAVARDPGVTADRWGTAATLKLALLGLVGPLYLAAPLLAHRPWDTTLAVWLLGLAIALQAFVENAVSVFTAVQRLEQELQVRLVEKTVLVGVGFTALGLGAGLLGVVSAFVIAAAVSFMFATWRVHRRLAPLEGWWRPAGAPCRSPAPAPAARPLGRASGRARVFAIA